MAKGESFESTEPKEQEVAEAKEPKGKQKKIESYEVQNAVRVLMEAEHIKENKPLMAEVHRVMKKGISSISDIRAASKKLNEPEEEGEEG